MGFKLGKNKVRKTPDYKYFPKNLQELRNAIRKHNIETPDLDLNDIDVSQVTDFGELFAHFENETIDISGWDMSNAENLGGMFVVCKNLKYVNINGIDTSNVRNMNRMFATCKNLKKIDGIENLNVDNLEACGQMFIRCESLTELDLSKWKPKKLTHTYLMFSECHKLKTIGDISNWDMSKVWNMDSMFLYCENLRFTGDLNKWNVNNTIFRFTCDYMFTECDLWDGKEPKWFNGKK